MTDKSESERPGQVTLAGWVALVASALMVLSVFEAVSIVHTVDFRDGVREFLATPTGKGLSLDPRQFVDFLRGVMLFTGAAAAAATVFAVFVLQRHNAARLGFTLAAVAIMLSTPTFAEFLPATTSAGFLPVLIAFPAILLWTKPARDWFAGLPPAPAGQRARSGDRSNSAAYVANRTHHRLEGRLLSSENRPPNGEKDGEDTAPWPRMPEDASPRPVPPPTYGFGTPP